MAKIKLPKNLTMNYGRSSTKHYGWVVSYLDGSKAKLFKSRLLANSYSKRLMKQSKSGGRYTQMKPVYKK